MTGADGEGMFRHACRLDREGSSLNGVPSEQPQLLHLLAEAAQTSQRLVFLSGKLELLKLEDLQCEQNGAAATRVYRRDRLEQPVQGDFLGAQARFDKLEAYVGRRSLDHCAWPASTVSSQNVTKLGHRATVSELVVKASGG